MVPSRLAVLLLAFSGALSRSWSGPQSAIAALVYGSRSLPEEQRWRPKASEKLSWQWILEGPIPLNYNVSVYDIDLFTTNVSTIKALQNKGMKVICYFSAGSYEWWRADWRKFFPFVGHGKYKGNRAPFAGKMEGWDERWLDIRRLDLLRPIMTSRIQKAAAKGCDGVEPDIMDAWDPDNVGQVGKDITGKDQLKYNKFIANTAHLYNLSVGLKNDLGQLEELVEYFDFAVNEQCFEFSECNRLEVFTNQNKAVFGAEYSGKQSVFCPLANAMNLSFQKKKLNLFAWRIGCENY